MNLLRVLGWTLGLIFAAVAIFALALWGSHLASIAAHSAKGDPSWAQTIGSVLAILVGFTGVLYQVERAKSDAIEQRAERGRAAHLLAFDALETLTERLEAILKPGRTYPMHRLRGERTNEMVAAMREIETSTLPASMLADFIRLRSRVYAINQRITEIYRTEDSGPNETKGRNKTERRKRLNSSVQVWNEAVSYFEKLDGTAVSLGGATQPLTKPVEITTYEYPADS